MHFLNCRNCFKQIAGTSRLVSLFYDNGTPSRNHAYVSKPISSTKHPLFVDNSPFQPTFSTKHPLFVDNSC